MINMNGSDLFQKINRCPFITYGLPVIVSHDIENRNRANCVSYLSPRLHSGQGEDGPCRSLYAGATDKILSTFEGQIFRPTIVHPR